MEAREIQRGVELLGLITKRLGGKAELIGLLSRDYGLQVPAKAPYAKILEGIVQSAKEESLCQDHFGVGTFAEAWSQYESVQGLSMLGVPELLKLAEFMSDGGIKWKYKKSGRDMLSAILQNATHAEVASALNSLMVTGTIGPFVRQNQKWVIGPCGITLSVESRKASKSWDLADFVESHLGESEIPYFMRIADYLPRDASLSKDRPHKFRVCEFLQLVFTHSLTEQILGTINRMIGDRVLKLHNTELLGRIVATPCGVFETEYSRPQALADLILREYSKEDLLGVLSRRKYFTKDLKLGTLEMCYKERPEELLDALFCEKDLVRFAKEMGLVSVYEVSLQDLIRILTLRLGFNLPPKLEGYYTFMTILDDQLVKLDNPRLTDEERDGIMGRVWRELEGFLIGLVYFYCAVLWQVDAGEEPPEGKESENNTLARVNSIIKKEKAFDFQKREGLERATIGDLIKMIRAMNSRVLEDSKLSQRLQQHFGRNTVVPPEALKIVDDASRLRGNFVHDRRAGRRAKTITLDACRQVIEQLKRFARLLDEEMVYPRVIRVRKEVIDEYGRMYIEAVDDTGKEWTIGSETYLHPETAYFMHSITNPIAIEPIIVEKL